MNTSESEFREIHQGKLYCSLPTEVVNHVEELVEWERVGPPIILASAPKLNRKTPPRPRMGPEGNQCLVYPKRINDIRFINKFFEAMNARLAEDGYFIGCVETSGDRKDRMMARFAWPLNILICILDYLVWRVWPKLPRMKKLYFLLTQGRNRVLSEMETYGRLYSCGFRLVGSMKAEGKLYFIAQKKKEPAYNMQATYGPLIRLRRLGKGGKPIKVLKLRTMYPYAEYIQEYVYEEYGLERGGKIKNDPRVSLLGRFMRKTFLDELPMLINFIKGDLKLFGVRPLSAHYFSLYPPEFQEYRKQFKPGVIPPFYVDFPDTLDEIVESEYRYLQAYKKKPVLTDIRYFFGAVYNITRCKIFKKKPPRRGHLPEKEFA